MNIIEGQKKMYSYMVCIFIYCFFPLSGEQDVYDCAVVGIINFADGIGRQSIGFLDAVSHHVKVKFISSRFQMPIILQDVPESVLALLSQKKTGLASVVILEDLLTCETACPYKHVPFGGIKLAYTMVESTSVCPKWVEILNKHFDAALVPDPYLVQVYKDSGVIIPIFVLPLGMYSDDLLKMPLKKEPHKPFVFGFSGSFVERKNHICLLKAFLEVFHNHSDVKLILHGRNGDETYGQLQKIIDASHATNVDLIRNCWSATDYENFLMSLDCYVSVSKGEGFSLTPREAMAAGIPCILSSNTAQESLCATGFVYPIASSGKSSAYYPHLYGFFGDYFESDELIVAQALQDVYENYNYWRKKAEQARLWISQFSYSHIWPLYVSIVKPKTIVLDSNINQINEDSIITTSFDLYHKYQKIIKNKI